MTDKTLSRAEVEAIRKRRNIDLIRWSDIDALCDTALRLWKGIDWRIERIVELENRCGEFELVETLHVGLTKERDRLREDIEHALGHIDKPEEAEVILRAALEADDDRT